MARFGGRHLGDGFYAEPEWWPEYLRLEREESDQEPTGIDSRELWAHVFEHWRSCVLPDLQRFYPRLPADDEQALLALPWRSLREVFISLFGIRDSMTGATFARLHDKKEGT
ncbi:hypothetical protein [Leucobacter sp. MMO-75]|uniref:hypothetical protein n=1 Tax=Leucobacter sp. MMO-75 TaxID=3081267 RepID=UPI0030175288